MKAFITLNTGLLQSRPLVKLWLLVMLALNLIVPIGLLPGRAPVIVLATMMLSIGLMTLLTARFGFSRILGLGHILWIPLSFYLISIWADHPINSPLGLWLRLLTLINLISLVIDTTDVIGFLKGERQAM